MSKAIVIVLDGVGAGEAPDASLYNDTGANTLKHIAEVNGGLSLPNLEKLGLGYITDITGVSKTNDTIGCYGKLKEESKGKDSTSGHWELAGLVTPFDFPMYYEGFPDELINQFIELNGLKGILGNKAASGTEIISELGDEHVKSGFPIVYTSQDSVFQIAAHEEIIPLEKLYKICKTTREKILIGKYKLGRVIARPFLGKPGEYYRTTNRKDYSVMPHGNILFDILVANGITTYAVGKIGDLYAYQSIDNHFKTTSNLAGIQKTVELIKSVKKGYIMTNLVDFDQNFGHRRDPIGFANALKEFDDHLPEIINCMDDEDVLMLTADHGNDPTYPGSDHTREFAPILTYGKKLKVGIDLGIRGSFADLAKTLCDYYKFENELNGVSFWALINNE